MVLNTYTDTHTLSIQAGPDNTAATLTFTLHSLCTALVFAHAAQKGAFMYVLVCVCVCVFAGLPLHESVLSTLLPVL